MAHGIWSHDGRIHVCRLQFSWLTIPRLAGLSGEYLSIMTSTTFRMGVGRYDIYDVVMVFGTRWQ